jgi:two-component system, chemotaxis family, CheB/CheR fusion protein
MKTTMEMEELHARLQEAEETLRAIRHGEVDALVVTERRGERVYTLKSADRPYRLMIEGMRQGAVTLTAEGLVLYCNACFAGMLRMPLESIIGSHVGRFVGETSRDFFAALLRQEGQGQGEVTLETGDGSPLPVYVAFSELPLDEPGEPVLCMVVTDLTEQKRSERIVADEKLARSILDHVAEVMVVCGTDGRIRRANPEAHRLCGRNPLLEPFEAAFPVELASGSSCELADVRTLLARVLAGERLRGIEASLDGGRVDLMLSAGPLWSSDGRVEGCVITLTDMTARRRAERELKQAWAAAEAMNQAKDRFLATLSHELRTPLTPVLALISALEGSDRLPDGLQREITMVRRNVELEARLIDDLLDLTRVSSGKLQLDRQDVDLREVIEHAVQTCSEELATGRRNVVIELADEDHHIWGDAPRLTQVFWNLLNNAVKFTPEGATISVRSQRESPTRFAVEVTDTGVGIDPEVLPRIFDAFEQGEASVTRRFGGLGLGLAISRTIVELHGGSISVCSEGKERGTTFSVHLPVGPRRIESGEPASVEAPAAEHAPLRLRILLVEDHSDTASALADLLRVQGHLVRVAGTVAQALALAEKGDLDLVVSDLGLPDGSGQDLMRKLSQRFHLRGIALSGYGMEDDVRRSREAGFEQHLTKPVNLQALEAAIQQVASQQEPARS